jgi:hypothetical protein
MRCQRLIALVKSWYISVKEETMAPARMVAFMEKHIATCPVCLEDPDVREEVEKMTDFIFPEAKQLRAMALEAAADDDDDDDFIDDIAQEAQNDDGDTIEEDIAGDDDEPDPDENEQDE